MTRKNLAFFLGVVLLWSLGVGIAVWGANWSITEAAIADDVPHLVQTDSLTQIMWPVIDQGMNATWEEACRTCEELRLEGYSDWRLPRAGELPLFSQGTATVKKRSGFLWTGSLVSEDPERALSLAADTINSRIKHEKGSVRCVRGGSYGSFDPLEGIIRKVPRDYPNIQAAINAAQDGDLVLVSPGVYKGSDNKNLTWDARFKHLTIKSVMGPACTTIDCEGEGRGFGFFSGHNHLDVIDGFTIRNGAADEGGGIYCEDASPLLRNLILTDNAAAYGGACYLRQADPYFANLVLAGNQAEYGAGLCFVRSKGTVLQATVTGNQAFTAGGAIVCYQASPSLTNSILWGNKAGSQANQVYLADADCAPIFNHCNVQGGSAGVTAPAGVDLSPGWPAGNLDVAPRFQGAAAPDDNPDLKWSLQADSPCMEKGAPLGAPTSDLRGLPRLQGQPPDLGAYEWQGGEAPAPVPCDERFAPDHEGIIKRWKEELSGRVDGPLQDKTKVAAPAAAATAAGGSKKSKQETGPYNAIFINFKGLTSTHISYHWHGGVPGDTYNVELKAKEIASGNHTTLVQGGPYSGSFTFSGNFHHTGLLPQGGYEYYFRTFTNGQPEDSRTYPVTLDEVAGELLFDENINGNDAGVKDFILGTIKVPQNLTLTLANSTFTVTDGNFRYDPDLFPNSGVLGTLNIINQCFVKTQGNLISIPQNEWGRFLFKDSIFSISLSLDQGDTGNFEAQNCQFLKGVSISGGAGKPAFRNCDIEPAASFTRNSAAIFEGNVFHGPIYFSGVPIWQASPNPTLVGNSFVGPVALSYSNPVAPAAKIPIGQNYYGDRRGPGGTGGFLCRGAVIDPQYFAIQGVQATGRHRAIKETPPSFWMTQWYCGQNTIDWNSPGPQIMKKGVESLLVLDVVTSDQSVSGARLKVTFDGKLVPKYYPGGRPHQVMYRDLASYGGDQANFHGQSTHNFILPATDKDQVLLKVELDASSVVGYKQPGPVTILVEQVLQFAPLARRPLNIVVHPVQIMGLFYDRGIPPVLEMRDSVRELLGMMLPFRPGDLNIWAAPPVTFWPGPLQTVSTTALVNNIANSVKLFQGLANLCNKFSGGTAISPDRQVVVLMNGNLGSGVEGANLPLRRSVIFVDEKYPAAFIHELGHSVGLYTGWGEEQYDQYPPDGLPLQGMTAFSTMGLESITCVPFFSNQQRLLHFFGTGHPWFNNRGWYDVMSAVATSVWPLPKTFADIRSKVFTELMNVGEVSVKKVESGPPIPGYKRFFFSATTTRVEQDGVVYHVLQPGKVRVADITPVATADYHAPNASESPFEYILEVTTEPGGVIYHQWCFPPTPDQEKDAPELSWINCYDLPENTKRLRLFNLSDQSLVYFDVTKSNLTNKITSHINGDVLGDILTLKWDSQGVANPGQLQHLVLFSNDHGDTWITNGQLLTSHQWQGPTQFLKTGDQVSIRVFSSDGINSSLSQVDGLKILPRTPKATILFPKEGAVAVPKTAWPLAGQGHDPDDGFIGGVWHSSLDGNLPGNKDAVLSPGAHELTYTVTNSHGKSASAKVNVTVQPMPTVDLALTTDSLYIQVPGRGPHDQSPVVMDAGKKHHLFLKFDNTGVRTFSTASLYVTPPGQSEKRLAQKRLDLAAFQEGILDVYYTPRLKGTYRFRAVLDQVKPPESNPVNNQRTWIIGAEMVLNPQFNPGKGTFKKPQKVAIWSRTEGAKIRYTTDGSTPTPTYGTVLGNGRAITIATTTLIKAVAYKSGWLPSQVTSAQITINP